MFESTARLNEDLAKHLLDAADWLERHEWCQQSNWRSEMGHEIEEERDQVEMACLMGSLMIVENDQRGADSTGIAANAVWRHLGLPLDMDIIAWNDSTRRTKEHVVEALRKTAYSLLPTPADRKELTP